MSDNEQYEAIYNILTSDEVCALLKIERSYLSRLVNEKQFPENKIGHKTLRYDKRAIEKWLLKTQHP